MKKFLGCLLLGIHAVASGAASSVSVIGRVDADSDGEQVIQLPSPGSPRELRKSSGGSRTRGSRVNIAAFCAELDRVGITSNDLDGAKDHIEQQLNLIASATPRSNKTIDILRSELRDVVQHRKAALSESTGVRSTLGTASSSPRSSDDDISTPLDHNDSDEESKTWHEMLAQVSIANQLVTQSAVRAQDSYEQAKYEAQNNKRWAYAGLGFGVLGIALSLVFGGLAFIPT